MLKEIMLKRLFVLFLFPFFALAAGTSFAFETKGQDCSKCHTLTRDEAKDLIKTMAPDIKVLEVRFSPSKTLWEVFSESGGRKMILYVDVTKKYLISGSTVFPQGTEEPDPGESHRPEQNRCITNTP